VHVVVVGAGVVGLASALRLAEAGHRVEVLTAAPPLQTTSAVAAALWYPYRALPEQEVTRWAAVGFAVLSGLEPAAGVALRSGRELFRAPTPDPWWRDAVPDLQRVPPAELPPGWADGLRLTAPVVDMGVHLPWLVARLAALDVPVRVRPLAALEQAGGEVVVDCAGLGARELAGDPSLHAVRGQVVVVEQVGLTEWLLAQDDPAALTYVVPRERTVVLGGVAEEGSEVLEPDPATAQAVLARCAALVPELAGARVLEHRVGLRPARPAVRLEAGRLADGRRVVHDYGHGGAGVTLAYGCALDVVALVDGG
jgi:D-amino-acid oxidase